MAKGSFLRHACIYGAGNLLVYAAGFVLLPLYVRCLTPGEYGTLDVLNRLSEVILLCLLFKGLRLALISFYSQAKDEAERRAVVGTSLLFTLLFLGVGGAAACLAAEPICRALDLGEPDVLALAVLAVFLESYCVLLLSLAQARIESLFFSLVSIGQFLVRVALCIALVTCLDWGVRGVLAASAVSSGVFALWMLGREVARGGLRVDPRQLREMFRFSLPFVPAGFAGFLLNSGDRFFLLAHVTPAELGAYALGYKLALVVKLFSRRPLYQVWSVRMYQAAREPDAPVVFGKVVTRILAMYVGVALALTLTSREVVRILAGEAYSAAAGIIDPVVLAYFFLTAADLMESGLYILRKTAWKMAVFLVSTAATLALYALLIPGSGIHGAALATLGGLFIHALLTAVVAQRIFPVRYEWGRVGLLLLWAVLIRVVGEFLPASLLLLPLKGALWLAWPVLVWATVLDGEEKAWCRSAGRKFMNRLPSVGKVRRPRAAMRQEPVCEARA